MPQVPVRTSPGVTRTGGQLRGARPAVIDGFNPRAPQMVTPQLVTGQVRGTRADPRLVAGITPEIAAMPGEQTARMGRALGALSEDASRVILDIQAQANGLVVDNAINQSKEAAMRLTYDKGGFKELTGYDALNRPDGKSLSEEYLGKFDQTTAKIAETFKNDAQRQAFAREREGIRMSLEAQAVQHETAQFREYNMSTHEGTIATELNTMGANYNKPDIIAQSGARLKGAVAMQGMALGKSAAWIEAKQLETVSKGHINVLGAALEDGNIDYADAYLKQYAKDMTAEDTLRYRGLVNKEVDLRAAINVAAEVMGAIAPAMGGETSFEKLHSVMRDLETGNRETDSQGRRMVSSKGARGVAQVTPDTARDPGFGVKPSDGTPEDDARMGRDYLAAMVKRYGGDPGKALAAYNAGPGALDDAVARAKKEGGSWLRFVPGETQSYVTRGITKLGGGSRKGAKPSLEDALAQAENHPIIAGNTSRIQFVRGEVEYRFKIAEESTKVARESAREQAMTMIAGGTSFAALPASVRNGMDPDDLDTVSSFAERMGKGQAVKTDMSLYYLLKSDPKALGAANLMAYQDKLGESELKDLIKDQTALRKNPAQFTRVQTDQQMISMRLAQIGIKPTPGAKPADKDDREKVARIWSSYGQRLEEFEVNAGRKATDKEREGIIDRMLLTVDVKGQGATPMALLTEDSRVDIPKAERQQIEAALIKAKRPVTEQAILSLYLTKVKSTGNAGGE